MFNISITDDTKSKLTKTDLDNVGKRISSKCDVFEDYIEYIKVKLSKTPQKDFVVKVIVTTTNRKETITSSSTKSELFEAVDDVRQKIYVQLEKLKGRYMNKRTRKEISDISETKSDIIDTVVNLSDEVVKIKKRDVKPMLLEEAIEQMNLLKHDFFIYLDAETNIVNVLYKRKEGNYGLIETVISN